MIEDGKLTDEIPEEYENWTAEDCYWADTQIKLLNERVAKLQKKLDELAGG